MAETESNFLSFSTDDGAASVGVIAEAQFQEWIAHYFLVQRQRRHPAHGFQTRAHNYHEAKWSFTISARILPQIMKKICLFAKAIKNPENWKVHRLMN